MDKIQLSADFSVSPQISADDLASLRDEGVTTVICNRPDGEEQTQPEWQTLAAQAQALGMQAHLLPVVHDTINSHDVRAFAGLLEDGGRIHAFCRSGARSTTLWALAQIHKGADIDTVKAQASAAGKDLGKLDTSFAGVIDELRDAFADLPVANHCPVLVIGGGSAGIALAASLLRRSPKLDITIVEPSATHYYQPGFTRVGGGVFTLEQTRKYTEQLIPAGVKWIQSAVTNFLPEANQVVLANRTKLSYDRLCISAGLKLNWGAIAGLEDTLGRNGVTSNYLPELAPYTWELASKLGRGTALFTQPPMPIKCAGAPQKALYLSACEWEKRGVLPQIDIEFHNAGAALFGVKDFVPALQSYIDHYGAKLALGSNLVRVDGDKREATFATTDADGNRVEITRKFDMLHVCPPQCAPDFIRNAPVADRGGWVDVDPQTLQHRRFANIWGLGDVTNTPNAKTAAAVRKQAPIVAENLLKEMQGQQDRYAYDGYGACPLTVERGKIVLAEFGYGGKLLPSLPVWLLRGTKPTWLAWWLKTVAMPIIYWRYMLKGKEPLAKPGQKV